MLGEQLATALLCVVLAVSDKRQQNKLIHPLGLEVTPQLANRVYTGGIGERINIHIPITLTRDNCISSAMDRLVYKLQATVFLTAVKLLNKNHPIKENLYNGHCGSA